MFAFVRKVDVAGKGRDLRPASTKQSSARLAPGREPSSPSAAWAMPGPKSGDREAA
jgi:hypothetical protein